MWEDEEEEDGAEEHGHPGAMVLAEHFQPKVPTYKKKVKKQKNIKCGRGQAGDKDTAVGSQHVDPRWRAAAMEIGMKVHKLVT